MIDLLAVKFAIEKRLNRLVSVPQSTRSLS